MFFCLFLFDHDCSQQRSPCFLACSSANLESVVAGVLLKKASHCGKSLGVSFSWHLPVYNKRECLCHMVRLICYSSKCMLLMTLSLLSKQIIPSGSSAKNFGQSNSKIIDVIVLVIS